MEDNPIVELSEFCQKNYGKSILTKVIGKTGPDHNPVVEVEITLPTGEVFNACGPNQKVAKQRAALEALQFLNV
jgi:dsRNA-specific ribonuclease